MEELPLCIHTLAEGDPSSDTIKVALYGPNAILGPTIDTYTTTGEISGGGYSAGGNEVSLTIVGASGSSRGDGAQFSDPYINPVDDLSIPASGVAVRGLMMYNASQGNRNIFTLDLGETLIPSDSITMAWNLAAVASLNEALIPLIGNTI